MTPERTTAILALAERVQTRHAEDPNIPTQEGPETQLAQIVTTLVTDVNQKDAELAVLHRTLASFRDLATRYQSIRFQVSTFLQVLEKEYRQEAPQGLALANVTSLIDEIHKIGCILHEMAVEREEFLQSIARAIAQFLKQWGGCSERYLSLNLPYQIEDIHEAITYMVERDWFMRHAGLVLTTIRMPEEYTRPT